MTVSVNGYMRTRLGHTEYVESHLRDEPAGRTFSNGTSKHATPNRTPEQQAALRKKFGKR
jgi:hypothetical protein